MRTFLRYTVLLGTGLGLGKMALAATPVPVPAPTSQSGSAPPVLEAEVADVVPLRPLKDHDLLIGGGEGGGVRIIDGDTLQHVAQLYTAPHSNYAVDPLGHFFYVAETYWSLGNRGQRRDLVTVYDGATLNLAGEIPLPGRLLTDPKTANFDISSDGHFGYVYNFEPASSVVVVDLHKRKVTASLSLPGCGLVYAWGERSFASLCADGTLATVVGTGPVARTQPFFDAEHDPVFDESVVDRKTGKAFFLTYTGSLFEVQLAEHPQIGASWSLQQAAGLSPATTATGRVTWRPGADRLAAYHRRSGRLFVLMHEGVHWTQAQPGTEVWVLDTASRKLLARYPVPQSASSIAVTQDVQPVLFALSEEWLWVLNPDTGEVLHGKPGRTGSLLAVKDF